MLCIWVNEFLKSVYSFPESVVCNVLPSAVPRDGHQAANPSRAGKLEQTAPPRSRSTPNSTSPSSVSWLCYLHKRRYYAPNTTHATSSPPSLAWSLPVPSAPTIPCRSNYNPSLAATIAQVRRECHCPLLLKLTDGL